MALSLGHSGDCYGSGLHCTCKAVGCSSRFYFLGDLRRFLTVSVTVVFGLRLAALFFTNRPVTALRTRLPAAFFLGAMRYLLK